MHANPEGGVVSAGDATITNNASTVHIDQHTDRAVIDWRGFDIAPNERTEFQQPGSGSIALNRVNSTTASHIDGQLSANGNIVIVNQNGVVFGRGAQVDVNSLVATTSDIGNDRFMAGGKLVFDKPGNPDAQIINEGTITAKDAGLVGLVAPRVENRGVITARLGRVHLASGDTATVDFYGDGLLEVAVSDNVTKQLVSNTGVINADGGLVAMTAAAGKNIVDSVVTSQGSIAAKSVAQRSGKVLIAGNSLSDVIIDGLIDASGLATGQTGGAVHIIGRRIALMNAARIDVSGNAGAGEILVGGDYHGGAYRGMLAPPSTAIEWGNTPGGYSAINGSPTAAFFAAYYAGMSSSGIVPTASRVYIGADVMLVANSDAGNAGRIITWSNNGTVFNGHADVSANGISGNGGFIEISGKDWLAFNGTVNTHAAHGVNGMLLLDPADITISNLVDNNITGASPFDSTGAATSNLNVTTLQNALASGSVTITSAAGAGGTGNITFTDAVAWNSANALTVTASNNIIVNNTITNSGSGSVTLNANIAGSGSITINDNISTGGSITALANGDVTLAATKTLTTGTTGALNLQAANGAIGGTGNLTINGNLSVGSGGLTLVSGINGTRPNYTANTTTLVQNAGTLGAISITGFQDVSIARAITSNSTITINPQRDMSITAAGSLTSTGAGALISITAQRDLTVSAGGSITTNATGALSLQAANGVIGGTGNLNIAGNLSVGSGNFTLVSGINGARPSLTINNTTFTQQGASIGVVSITGLQDVTIAKAMTSSGAITISPQQDFIVAASGNLSSTGASAITVLAQRDITVNASGVIASSATGGITLQAANNSIAGVGNLTINGNLSVGTGSLTLVSGINGTRPSLTLNTTTLTPLGATIGAISITGLQDVTVARNITSSGQITISPQRDFILNASTTLASTGGSLLIVAQRDFTTGASSVLSSGPSSSLTLQAANGVIGNTGNLTLGGNISNGTGTLTLTSGINGTRPSLTLNSTNFTQQGASVGVVIITGFLDVTLSRNITSSGAITISPQQDFILSASQTLATTGASLINITAQRDIITNASSVINTGASGSLTLAAANAVVTGTGNLTLGGNLSVGSGTLTLSSGINGTRPSWTIDNTSYTQNAATVGVVTINGFQDVTVSKAITGSGAITINPQRDFILSASQTITTGGAGVFTVLAQRDITTNASSVITTGSTGGVSLRAANAVVTGTGNLTLGGKINIGTGALTLLSGINGTRPSLTLNSTSLAQLGATIGAISITGFQDVTQAMNIAGSSTITISPQRDYILNASQTLSTNSASAITILAQRDITTNASSIISAGSTGSLTLQAANNVVTGTGNLTLGGNLSVGSGTLTLSSGINGTRPSWTIDNTSYTQNAATVGVVTINGFQDVTVSKAITGSGAITINPQRDFILSASQTITTGGAGVFTVLAQRDITLNASSVITTGSTGGVSLRAANAVVTGTGNLTLGGKINIGTGALTLVSGINGTRPSWTMDNTTFAMLGATVGTTSITGLQDVTVATSITGSGSITIATQRDLTLSASQTITTGAAGALVLTAANNVVAGTGNLTINGNLSVGTGALTLTSGINGTRPSYTMTATNFTQQGATLGAITISGFLDFTVNRDLTSSGAIALISNRDLTISATRTITGGAASAISMQAANGAVAGTGNMNMLGTISVGTGNLTLLSGINGTRPSLTLNSTNLIRQGATFGAINMQGFATLTIARPINTTSTVTFSNNTSTALASDITSTGAMTFSNAVVIAEAATVNITSTNANITFSSTVNGTAGGVAENLAVSAGTGTVAFSGIVGGTAALGNLSVTADNLTLSANANGTGTLTLQPVTAGRIIVIGGAQADNLTTNGFNLSTAEVGRFVNGWGSIVIGNTSAGALTNSVAAWNDTVSFITGNDFASTVAITSADPIFVQAVRDVLLTQNITTTNTSANAIVLVAGRNFINTASANPLTTGAGGRWLVYSTDPTGTTGEQTMSNAFNRYSCTYGGSCPSFPGTGNGLMYSYTPLLDVTIDPQTYNYGDAVIAATGYTLQTSGYLNALDTSQGVVGGVGNFSTTYVQGNNAGTSFTVTNNGSTFTSNLGYGFNYVSPTGLTVGQRAITVQVSNQTAVYGNALNTSAYTLASGSFYSTDAATLALTTNATLSSSGNYNYSATPWTLSANGANFTTGLASNYNITYLAAPTGLTITQRALTVTATGVDRVYNGLMNASVTLGDNRIAGDALTLAYSGASFGDKNVGVGKAISVTGINVTNTDSGNYSFNTTASASANITQRTLTISASGINKVYDGLTTATATLTDDRVAGDVFSTTYTGNFADKNVAVGKSVSITGINIATGDAANYSFNTTANTTASIIQRALTISATGVNKVYDGLATAAVNFGDNRVTGDSFTINYTGNFSDKNVGTAKTVSVTGINLTGADSGNYSYATTASASADITPRSLVASALGNDKVYDGSTNASVSFTDNRIAGDTFGYTYTANFTDKNVGNGKAISVTSIGLVGADAGNYATSGIASTSANITPRALLISATGVNKQYDGNTTASVTLSDNRVSGDVLTLNYSSASYADSAVGTNKPVTVTGIGLSGVDSGNYTYNISALTASDIINVSPVVAPPVVPPVVVPIVLIVPAVRVTAPAPKSLAQQLPNTVKKGVQAPLSIPEFLLFDDEWQKRQQRLPTLGMLH